MKWSKLEPKEFYFHVLDPRDDSGYNYVAIVPAIWFDECGEMNESGLGIENLLPDTFWEEDDGYYEVNLSRDQIKEELLSRGFQESVSFANYFTDPDTDT